jgi:hypothetical protein
VCAACGDDAVVNWQRRPTAEEVAHVIAVEVDRRTQLLLLADPQLPRPDFGPLPTGDGMTRSVFACGRHAITLEGAALVHESTCTAPNTDNLPGCDCTPETTVPEPFDGGSSVQLPAHWITPGD